MQQQLTQAIKHWKYVAPIVAYPKNENQYEQLVSQLEELLDLVQNDEIHPLMGLVDVLSHLISNYEKHNHSAPKITGVDALKFLMESRQLSQSDLPEIGSQGVVSEILREKRQLNVRQIKLLTSRFQVDPATFIDI